MDKDDTIQPNYLEIGSEPVTSNEGFVIGSTPEANSQTTPPTPTATNIVQVGQDGVLSFGTLRSPNFSTGNSGWRITSNGDVEFGDGYFRGDITGATGTFTGTITATGGAIGGFDIGTDYIRDTSNTFGLASTVTGGDDVRFWAGDTYANRATADFRVTEAGAVTASNFSFTGGNVGSAVVVAIGALNIAARGWTQTSVFSVGSSSTVDWSAGTFTSADGTSYSIVAGATSSMSAPTYIYLDTAVSTTAYQTTTTATTAVGAGKVLIAKAENGTTDATFQVFGGIGGQHIDAESIAANSITANQLNTALLYAGSIEIDPIGNIRSGQLAYDEGDGWWLGNDAGTPKFSIGNNSGGISYGTIAFDAVSNGGEDSSVSSSTHSHTCTGTGLVLFVLVSINDATLADRTVSSVTYNGVACTKIQVNDNGDIRRTEIWALTNPTTGANNIVVTMGGVCTRLTVCGLSLTGAGSIVASGGVSQGGSVTSASTSLTSLVDNSWILGVLHTSNGGSAYVEGSSQTNRFTQAGTSSDVQISTKPIATAGSTSISWTWTTSAWRSLSAIIIQPKATVTYTGSGMTWDGSELNIRGNFNTSSSFIADEDLTAGQAVGISNYVSGKVARAFRTVDVASMTVSVDGGAEYAHSYAPIGGDKFVYVDYDTADDSLYATVTSIDPDTKEITVGTSSAATADISNDYFCVAKLDTDKFIVFYVEDASTTIVKYRIGTVSGTTISWGTAATFFTGATAVQNLAANFISTNKGIAAFKCSTAANSRLVAFTVSGTTATAGTAVSMGTNIASNVATLLRVCGTDKFACIANGYCQVGTLSGTTITLGSEVQFATTDPGSQNAYDLVSPTTDSIVVLWNNGGNLDMRAASISGTTPTFGTALTSILSVGGFNVTMVSESSSSILVFHNASSNTLRNISLSGNTLTNNGIQIQVVSSASIVSMLWMDNSYFVIFTPIGGNMSVYIEGMSNNFFGMAESTVNKGESVSVVTSGKVGGQSGLLPGAYYQVTSAGLVFASSVATLNSLDDKFVLASSSTEVVL